MEYFLGKTGDDMENITSELDKVISYTLGRGYYNGRRY